MGKQAAHSQTAVSSKFTTEPLSHFSQQLTCVTLHNLVKYKISKTAKLQQCNM